MAKAFGLRLALIVFSIETLAGLLQGRAFEATIQSALLFGGVFWGLGLFIGEVARQVIEEHVRTLLRELQTDPKHKTPSTSDKSTPHAGRGGIHT